MVTPLRGQHMAARRASSRLRGLAAQNMVAQRSDALDIEFLLAAAGGGGGEAIAGSGGHGGHGGAGGLIIGRLRLLLGGRYDVVIGTSAGDTAGEDSTFAGLVALGGGQGGHPDNDGHSGGSGGGGGETSGGLSAGGAGTPDQGFAGSGGAAFPSGVVGNGGGAGGPGSAFGAGPGRISSISGAPTLYCVGGQNGNPTAPGSGGQGGYGLGTPAGDAGTAGILVFRYPGQPRATGGVITQLAGYTIHTLTTSATVAVTG